MLELLGDLARALIGRLVELLEGTDNLIGKTRDSRSEYRTLRDRLDDIPRV